MITSQSFKGLLIVGVPHHTQKGKPTRRFNGNFILLRVPRVVVPSIKGLNYLINKTTMTEIHTQSKIHESNTTDFLLFVL